MMKAMVFGMNYRGIIIFLALFYQPKKNTTDSGVCSRLSGARMGRCHYQIRASCNDYFAVRIFIQNAYM